MERFKHIFNKLEKHLNNTLLSTEFSKVPVQKVQRIQDINNLRSKLPPKYQLEFDDYVNFYTANGYKSTFVNDEMFKVIEEKRKIKKFVKNNTNLQLLMELIPDLYMVGGCIRDIINYIKPKDIDLCTSLSYDEVHEFVKSLPNKDVGKQFLVNIVEVNSEQFEISTFRKDKSNNGGIQGTIEEDTKRRDFTCNALYYDLHQNELLDPNGGFDDCYSKTLKFIGLPKDRIIEDSCRVFRFFRFISEKGYKPDKKSLKACRENFEFATKNTNSQRILKELERIVKI